MALVPNAVLTSSTLMCCCSTIIHVLYADFLTVAFLFSESYNVFAKGASIQALLNLSVVAPGSHARMPKQRFLPNTTNNVMGKTFVDAKTLL